MSDIIKLKIRKTAELPGPPPMLCPRPTGGSQHPPPPPPPLQMSACFSKTTMPKFHLDVTDSGMRFLNIEKSAQAGKG